MANISAHIGRQLYKTTITTATNQLIADEPVSAGGQDLGFSPEELLAASLAHVPALPCACMPIVKAGRNYRR